MTAPAPVHLAETIEVETPELVSVSYTVAGVGSRAAAALIDYAICALMLVGLFIGFAIFSVRIGVRAGDSAGSWSLAVLTMAQFGILWLYYVLFEALMDGQTPGKRLLRLRVVRDGGLSVTFGASAIRNLVRIIDMQPLFFYVAGIVSVVASRKGQRLGDLAAGTIVVREAVVTQPMTVAAPPRGIDEPAGLHAALTDAEYDVLDRFMQRRMQLDVARREAFARQLSARFAAALSAHGEGADLAQLARLHGAEQAARRRGMSARQGTGAARERHAIVAAGAARWSGFAARLAEAQKRGLAGLGEEGVRQFVEEYRALTADLARLRTATRGLDASEVFYLNRLVSGAHNLLYRRSTMSPQRAIAYLFVDVPRQIRASALPIGLASVLLFGPMLIAATAVVRAPGAAQLMLPPGMLDRAERGVTSAQTGGGYIDDPQILRPVFASKIVTNNVQVAFFAFAAGMTAGLLTLWILVSNGVSIGAVFGLYISKGIGTLLLGFVAPHGVLELGAIAIAGGAGLLLGAAFVIPGARTRRRALVENGRRAIDLVAGATMLLVVAGMLEGFVSPNATLSLGQKLGVSAATAVLLFLFVRSGRGPKVRPAP
jgi:uncharacterized membrane protein SpoIIM required for sporulation/uncharacterized RDD family membrane protein YckC